MSETYEILALKYASITERMRSSSFMYPADDDHASPHPIDFFVWVVRNENRTILIDTGFDTGEGRRRDIPLVIEPHEALKRIGVDANDVETVVVTHLHFDHAGTLDRYPSAHFHVQESEVAFATGPCMCDGVLNDAYSVDHVCTLVRKIYSGRVNFHNGDGAVAPGITVHKVGGHTRGMQCVRVATESGDVVLASDATHFYENFETRKPFKITLDVADTLASYTRLEALATSRKHIVPGHDPLVLERYPAWKPETKGIVHRLDLPRLD